MKNKFLRLLSLMIISSMFIVSMSGCKPKKSDAGQKIPTTTDVLTINQDKYLFGLGELSSDINGGVDVEVDNNFIIGNVKALGVKSMRVWMHLHNIIRRSPDSDEISLLQGTAN